MPIAIAFEGGPKKGEEEDAADAWLVGVVNCLLHRSASRLTHKPLDLPIADPRGELADLGDMFRPHTVQWVTE